MSDTAPGIVAYGGYIPRLRLERASIAQAHSWFNPALSGLGKGQRAMAGWDEDVITMAVAAARDCLTGTADLIPESLLLASTSHVFKDRQDSVVVKEALNLQDDLYTLDISGSRKAGTSALKGALELARNSTAPVLCIGAEKMRVKPASEAEFMVGDGAAAIMLGRQNVLAEFIGAHSVASDFVDSFRQQDSEFDYAWESRWVRDIGYGEIAPTAIRDALEKFNISVDDIDHLVLPISMRGADRLVARKTGLDQSKIYLDLHPRMGNAGAAQSLIALNHCLEFAKPGEIIMLLGFGQGCDVLLFKCTEAIKSFTPGRGVEGALQQGVSEANYFKYLAFNNLLPIETGMRAEMDQKTSLTALYRDRKAIHGLVGGRCTETGTVQFPKSRISVNQQHKTKDTQEDYCFADVPAKIFSFTSDHLTYSIDPPSYYGCIEFEGGGRMMADFAEMEPEYARVGQAMRMEFRIKAVDQQRGFTRYFWKAVPVTDLAEITTEGRAHG